MILGESSRSVSPARPVIAIVGPTASGKSELAQRVALELDGEVVSADSMQVYKGMDIGTGKLAPEQRKVVHHGLDIIEPGQPFSAALYQDYARRCFEDIDARGKRCILCGGTGFYARAAIDDYRFPAGEQLGNPLRERYKKLADERGPKTVWDELHERDPGSAGIISPNDTKRVIRALELLGEGTTYYDQKQALADIRQLIPAVFVGLNVERDVLVERIEARVDAMFAQGLVGEVEGLLSRGLRGAITSGQAIGYKEIVAALDGEISLAEARERIKASTRRYAKRQRTWFGRDKRVRWIEATQLDWNRMTEQVLDLIQADGC